jgi:predicted AlkP superfamily phosphohydrolase/phosphomutase
MERTGKEGTVDWEHTDVIASGQGPVYLTLNSASPRYERLRTELIEKLTELSDDHGNPVASEVYRGEEVYEGRYLNDAPDIVIDQSPGVHIPGNIGRHEVFTDPEGDGWRGENKRAGLFVATGPSFGRGHIEGLSILDLAPTLLHLHDCSIPKDMDGSVRDDVFASGADPVEREVSYRSGTANYAEKERIRRIARRADF